MTLGPITRSYERLVNAGKVGIRFDAHGNRILFSEEKRSNMARPELIYLASEGKLHIGFRRGNARYTNEQCNLAKSNEAGNLEETPEGVALPPGWAELERCELCFPQLA